MMINNTSTLNEAIEIAQKILGAYGVTHNETTNNFQDPYGTTSFSTPLVLHQ